MSNIRPSQRYKHYKGGLYTIVCLATHTETKEQLVVYTDAFGAYWARPYDMFGELVIQDGKSVPRFALITDATAMESSKHE